MGHQKVALWPFYLEVFMNDISKLIIMMQEYLKMGVDTNEKLLLYWLIDPVTKIVRYVGMTTKGKKKRYADHIYTAKRGLSTIHVNRWIKKLLNNGHTPILMIVGAFSNIEELLAKEKYWIKRLRDEGFPLTNSTEGGDYNSPTEDIREKISIAQKKRLGDPAVRNKMSVDAILRCSDPAVKEMFSKAQKIRFGRPEEVEKLRAKGKLQFIGARKEYQVQVMNAAKAKPEVRKKMSEGAKRRFGRPEELLKNSQLRKKYFSNPVNREKVSHSIKRLWEDPTYKETQLKALKEGRDKPESRKKISVAQKKRFERPEERLKCREKTIKYLSDPANRLKASELQKGVWQRKGFREKMHTAMKKAMTKRFEKHDNRNASAIHKEGREFVAVDVKADKVSFKGHSISLCAEMLGICRSSISRYLRNERKADSFKGYAFKYV